MNVASPSDEVQFLFNIQRLLTEGDFVASYKFALLAALADLSVETIAAGADQNADLVIPISEVARKFIELYWRQALPFFSTTCTTGEILHQNSNSTKRAEILTYVTELQQKCSGSLIAAKSNHLLWNSYIRKVAATIKDQPLWKLQKISGDELDFLYRRTSEKFMDYIQLRPGVASHFRRFHPLIRALIEEAWTRYIRKLTANQRILGQSMDLEEFLFGSERAGLQVFRSILLELQKGCCFYCDGRVSETMSEVDHFIPWAKYASDLGHNFVLTDSKCNNSKRDYLAGPIYLRRWIERNSESANFLEKEFRSHNVLYNVDASREIAKWAYEQAEVSNTKVWIAKGIVTSLDSSWRNFF